MLKDLKINNRVQIDTETEKKNVFAVDNEAFRYLIGIANKKTNMHEEKFYDSFKASWDHSAEEMLKMFRMIKALTKRSTKKIAELKEAYDSVQHDKMLTQARNARLPEWTIKWLVTWLTKREIRV